MQRDKIFGINPVTEALKAGRPVQRLLIAEQRKSDRDIQEIVRLAKVRGIEVRIESRDALNREVPKALHQGVIAVASAREYVTLDDILQIPAQKNRLRSSFFSTGLRTQGTLARFSARPRPQVSME